MYAIRSYYVGLGFGLQAVVNNFVSGLILLFERPVHVGDTVEVGDLIGTVRRIGIRASTVHTFLGADIVVPNSQMVAEKVTNWTLRITSYNVCYTKLLRFRLTLNWIPGQPRS